MGHRTIEVPFINNAGGINEATSPFQMAKDECQAALNVYFEKYAKYGVIQKRKGRVKLNASAMDGKIQSIVQFSLGSTSYLNAFTDNGTLYSIDINTGVCTSVLSGLDGTKRVRFSVLNDKVFMSNETDGLYYSTDNATWALVSAIDPNVPSAIKDIIVYDGRLFALTKDILYFSELSDGTDWTGDSGNFAIDRNDGDTCIALAKLTSQLIVFKQHSIHRIYITGDTSAIEFYYRREGQYSGPAGRGIGAVCPEAIQNMVLENLYADVWGKADYLMFLSDQGIFALGTAGNPINLDQRVRPTYNDIRKNRLHYSFMTWHPRRDQVWLCYPQGANSSSSNQLIFHTKAKCWSKYNFSKITAATTYVDSLTIYTIMGDTDGYLWQHDHQNVDQLSDYADGSDAIEAYWQSQYHDYGMPNRYKQLINVTARVKETDTDCPVTITVTGEDSVASSTTIATTGSGTGGRYDTAIVGTDVYAGAAGYLDKDAYLPMYCYNASVRFANSTINQSMTIYGYFVELKLTGNKGVR